MIGGSGRPQFQDSHCLRMRYGKSECRQCADACAHDAVCITEASVMIDGERCTDCAACAAACPTAALEITKVDFWDVVRKLDQAPSPVLGCDRPESSKGHASLPCLAYLAPEHMVALSVFLPGGVTVNMAQCGDCTNQSAAGRAVAAALRLRDELPRRLGQRLRVAYSDSELEFEPIQLDRRAFFSQMRQVLRAEANTLLAAAKESDAGEMPYVEKLLPRRRAVFERLIAALGEEGAQDEITAVCAVLGHTAVVDERCDYCFACVGGCPNGALGGAEDESDDGFHAELFFRASYCSGCGLCRDFCLTKSISIERGCNKGDVLEWVPVRETADSTARS